MTSAADQSNPAASVAAKVQRRVLPWLIAGWFIAYIDRFNVSFAALQMNQALSLSSTVFGFGAGVFFLGYALFEIPSNAILARVGARVWLARIMVTWGIISVAMIATQGPWSFYTLRFLLGVAEAGCFPGMAYYLSQWLQPRDRAAALASLATMAMVSGIVGAPLAAALLSLDGVLGLAGWQWLFLIEGLPAIALGWCLYKFLPDNPEQAAWLTATERAWLRSQSFAAQAHSGGVAALRAVASDSRYWKWGLAFFCVTAAGSALRLFQPTILRQVTGLGDAASALLTAVPSLAGMLAILYVGRRSTRLDERRWHAAVPMLIAALGFSVMGITYGVAGALIVASIATVGVASQPPLFASVSSVSDGTTKAVGIAFVNSVAAVGAFLGPYVVGYMMDRSGSLVIVGVASAVAIAIGALITSMTHEERPLVADRIMQPAATT
jgi:ACS family tartrate transporter-like MFS transporter